MNRSKRKPVAASITSTGISTKLIEKFSKTHKVEYPTSEKVIWLTRVLHRISTSTIGKDFALIGGSAIVFLYRDMYRFSTDLDLDFIGNKNLGKDGKAEIALRQKFDRNVLQQIAKDLEMGFEALRQRDDRFVQHNLTYRSEYTRTGIVELDMSYRYCHSATDPISRPWPITIAGVVPAFNAQTLKQEELYANKVLAMMEGKERLDFPGRIGLMFKRKIRHLFDVYLLADEVLKGNTDTDLALLHDLLVLFGMTRVKNFQYFRGNAIGSYTEEDVRNELRSVVPKGVTIPTVDVMKWEVRKFFDMHLFNWAKREHRFVEDFIRGNFRPEDLFGEGRIAKGLHSMHYYKEILGKVRSIDS